jgi:hypothetical protein
MVHWLATNWFNLAQTAGIVASLGATALALQKQAHQTQAQNLLTITEHHREIWRQPIEQQELWGVLRDEPLSSEEEVPTAQHRFVQQLILHLAASYEALRLGALTELEGLRADVHDFFTKPIPRRVWEESKRYQNQRFIAFVESCIHDENLERGNGPRGGLDVGQASSLQRTTRRLRRAMSRAVPRRMRPRPGIR